MNQIPLLGSRRITPEVFFEKLGRKEQKRLRQSLRRFLSRHNSHSQPWFREARRVNKIAGYRRLTRIDVLRLKDLIYRELVRAMVCPIRRMIDYQGLARSIFKVEPLPASELYYDNAVQEEV